MPRVAVSRQGRMSSGSLLLMCRADLPVTVGMGAVAMAVASCTFPERRACGGLRRLWLWRRVRLAMWPSCLNVNKVNIEFLAVAMAHVVSALGADRP